MSPEESARVCIDALLEQAGWQVHDPAKANRLASLGVVIRHFQLKPGHGEADYLLYVGGKACGVIEAKRQGTTLKGVEIQSARYAKGLPDTLPAWHRPLPFLFESTGIETQFTNCLDPVPRSRSLFAFFRPEQLRDWLEPVTNSAPHSSAQVASESTANPAPAPTFLARMQHLPELVTQWGQGGASYQLWPAQIKAVQNLEKSLAANKPRALIQMARRCDRQL